MTKNKAEKELARLQRNLANAGKDAEYYFEIFRSGPRSYGIQFGRRCGWHGNTRREAKPWKPSPTRN